MELCQDTIEGQRMPPLISTRTQIPFSTNNINNVNRPKNHKNWLLLNQEFIIINTFLIFLSVNAYYNEYFINLFLEE